MPPEESEPLPTEPPFYHAELLGGPEDGNGLLISQPWPQISMLCPTKDAAGKVLKRWVAVYKLAAIYPHPVYRYERGYEVAGDQW